MKTKLNLLLVAGLMSAAAMVGTTGCITEASQAELQARAQITQAQAQQTALEHAPGGTVKSSELEEEQGKLVWSIDIAQPKTKTITEVQVDAITGEVLPPEKGKGTWQETLSIPTESFAPTGRNRYFILEAGYQLVLEGKEGGKTVNLTITVLDDTKEVAGVSTRVVEERESSDGKLIEVSRNYCAIGTRTRNVYYFGEDVDVYKGSQVVHEGAWLAGVKEATFGILMPGDIRIGARYYQEKAPGVAMDRAENVSTTETQRTPAGTFTNCLKVKETTPLESGSEYKLYAPDVGLIQDGDLLLVKRGFVK